MMQSTVCALALFVVDNRPGASGIIASEITMKAEIAKWTKVVREANIRPE